MRISKSEKRNGRQSMMDEAAYVKRASRLTNILVRRERERTPGTLGDVWSRIERRWGIPQGTLFNLSYPSRWPRQIGAACNEAITNALRNEIIASEQSGLSDSTSPALRAAKAALGEVETDARSRVAPRSSRGGQ